MHLLVAELGATPLIGFAGAPFTLASYLVEGGPSKNHVHTKALMHGDPELWDALCDRLAQISGEFLRVQAQAGASAVQLFDSWAGALSRADYAARALPHSTRPSGPSPTSTCRGSTSGSARASCWPSWRRPAPTSSGSTTAPPSPTRSSGSDRRYAVQGNLDPALLFAPWEALERRVREIVEEGRRAPGHIFNLGHGVLPEVDPDVLTRVTALVHEVSTR